MAAANVVHQFEERKVVARHPDEVRQKNEERAQGAQPKPFAREKTALRREKQSGRDREDEERRAVFVLHSNADQDAEPKPVTWLFAVDRADDAPRATQPDQRLEHVHREPMTEQQKNRRGESGQRRQSLG